MKKRGFTLIEVTLFLALSSVLVVGIIAGTNRSITRQRYNNAVETFADFLKDLYSEVEYTQHDGNGRSNEAVYGKLAVFEPSGTNIHVYTINGEIIDSITLAEGGGEAAGNLLQMAALTPFKTNNEGELEIIEEKEKTLKWTAIAESPDGPLPRSVLIVRSPISGMITTLVLEDTAAIVSGIEYESDVFANLLNSGGFENKQIDFCINSDDKWAAGNFRRNVRINLNAHNSSAVEVMNDNDDTNQCSEDS